MPWDQRFGRGCQFRSIIDVVRLVKRLCREKGGLANAVKLLRTIDQSAYKNQWISKNLPDSSSVWQDPYLGANIFWSKASRIPGERGPNKAWSSQSSCRREYRTCVHPTAAGIGDTYWLAHWKESTYLCTMWGRVTWRPRLLSSPSWPCNALNSSIERTNWIPLPWLLPQGL